MFARPPEEALSTALLYCDFGLDIYGFAPPYAMVLSFLTELNITIRLTIDVEALLSVTLLLCLLKIILNLGYIIKVFILLGC